MTYLNVSSFLLLFSRCQLPKFLVAIMKIPLRLLLSLGILTSSCSGHGSHSHDHDHDQSHENAGSEREREGLSVEDLERKWGTDVSAMFFFPIFKCWEESKAGSDASDESLWGGMELQTGVRCERRLVSRVLVGT